MNRRLCLLANHEAEPWNKAQYRSPHAPREASITRSVMTTLEWCGIPAQSG
jgi:hypothetical protein